MEKHVDEDLTHEIVSLIEYCQKKIRLSKDKGEFKAYADMGKRLLDLLPVNKTITLEQKDDDTYQVPV